MKSYEQTVGKINKFKGEGDFNKRSGKFIGREKFEVGRNNWVQETFNKKLSTKTLSVFILPEGFAQVKVKKKFEISLFFKSRNPQGSLKLGESFLKCYNFQDENL